MTRLQWAAVAVAAVGAWAVLLMPIYGHLPGGP